MKLKEKWPHLLLAALVLGFCIYEVFWGGGQGADWWVGADYGQDQNEIAETFEQVRDAALAEGILYDSALAGNTTSAAVLKNQDAQNATDQTSKEPGGTGSSGSDAGADGDATTANADGNLGVAETGTGTAETAGTSKTAVGASGTADAAGKTSEAAGNAKKNDTLTCTLSVSCATILNHMDDLNADKAELIPKDGIIYPTTTVTFKDGESVFDVLKREMKNNSIHMEFVDTPGYSTSYIEGLANLYEFDCGPLSGWMYQVNGEFINYGCSLYKLKDGDVISWVYTCDLGKDVGNTSIGGE